MQITEQKLATRLGIFAVLALFLAALRPLNFLDIDVFHELALVRSAMQLGHLPTTDLFAYTPTLALVVHHEWLTGFVLYPVAMQGASAFLAFKYLLTLAVVAGAGSLARRRGASWPILIVVFPLFILLGTLGFTTIRAQVFTLLLTAVFLHFIEPLKRGPTSPRIVPALLFLGLYVIWLNLHAGFVVAPALLAAYCVEQFLHTRRIPYGWLVILVLMFALVPLNPFGVAYYPYLLRALSMSRPYIAEWEPIWQHPKILFLAYCVSLLVLGYAVLRLRPVRMPGLLLLLIAALAAAIHVRHCSLYAVVFLAYVPGYLASTPLAAIVDSFWSRHARVAALVGLVVLVAAMAVTLPRKPWQIIMPTSVAEIKEGFPMAYPVGPADYLHQIRFHGNLMTDLYTGAYCSWHLWPDVKVSFDSRYEVAYQPGVPEEIMDFYALKPHWQSTLSKYPTDLVLVRADSPLAEALPSATDPPWHCVYQDNTYDVFARPGLSLPVVHRSGLPLPATFP